MVHGHAERALEQLIAGTASEYVACHEQSQYNIGSNGQGLSACGLAAMNSARLIFDKERAGLNGRALLHEISKAETAQVRNINILRNLSLSSHLLLCLQEVLSICASWSNASHVDVEDIYTLPAFKRSLRLLTSEFGQPSVKLFAALLGCVSRLSPFSVTF